MQSKERKFLKISSIVIVLAIVLGFAFFQTKNLVSGPRVSIENPANGEALEDSLAQIKGTAHNIAEIRLNGRQIFVDENGVFEEKVLLSYGYNKVIVEVKDRFERSVKKELELILK